MKSHKLNDTQLFLEFVNQPNYKRLMAKFPLQEFISLKCWPSLYQDLQQQLFIWFYRHCLQTLPLAIIEENQFNLPMGGVLHFLCSGQLHIGYLITLPPTAHSELTPTYLSVNYGKEKLPPVIHPDDIPSLEHLLNSQHLSVFALGNSQIIASVNRDIADFLR